MRFIFLWLLRCFTSPGLLCISMYSTCNFLIAQDGLPHSDTPGSKVAWDLPEAFRSLPRPSSSCSVKASTVRPYEIAYYENTQLCFHAYLLPYLLALDCQRSIVVSFLSFNQSELSFFFVEKRFLTSC